MSQDAADYFDREYFVLHEGKRRYLRYLVDLLRAAGLRGGRVLDVGSGFGFLLDELAASGYRPYGIDVASPAVRAARRRGAAVARASAEEGLPFLAGSFDAVLVLDVIEHVRDFRRLLDECRRVLRPPGLLVVLTLNAHSAARPLLGRRWTWYLDPTHVWMFTPGMLRQALRESGFRPLRSTTMSNFCCVGEGNPKLRPLRRIGRVVETPWFGDSLLEIAALSGER